MSIGIARKSVYRIGIDSEIDEDNSLHAIVCNENKCIDQKIFLTIGAYLERCMSEIPNEHFARLRAERRTTFLLHFQKKVCLSIIYFISDRNHKPKL